MLYFKGIHCKFLDELKQYQTFSVFLNFILDHIIKVKIIINKIIDQDILAEAFKIRREVFVKEQEVDEAEEYEFEEESTHFIALVEGEFGGTARWRITQNGVKLERFAVLSKFRSMGVGSKLVEAVVADIPNDHHYLYLHAQITAMGLYAKFGFETEGDEFIEAGIRHYKMVLRR